MNFICFFNIFFRYGKKLLETMLSDYKLNMQELIILLAIHESPGIYQSKLINFSGLDKGNFSKLLKQLELNNLIYRSESSELTGQNQCFLTEYGKSLIPNLLQVINNWENAVTNDIDQENLAQFSYTSLKISNNLFNHLQIKW